MIPTRVDCKLTAFAAVEWIHKKKKGTMNKGDLRKSSLYKTELCRSYEETGTCRYGNRCQFAHSLHELRVVERHPKYKTEMCRTFWEKGACPYGKRCCFIHTELPEISGRPAVAAWGGERRARSVSEGMGIVGSTAPARTRTLSPTQMQPMAAIHPLQPHMQMSMPQMHAVPLMLSPVQPIAAPLVGSPVQTSMQPLFETQPLVPKRRHSRFAFINTNIPSVVQQQYPYSAYADLQPIPPFYSPPSTPPSTMPSTPNF